MFNSLSSWYWGKGEGEREGEGEKKEEEESTNDGSQWNKGLEVASGLFQSVSGYANSLTENVKKQVIDTTSSSFIGEFQREQEKFTRTQQRLKDASVPPWIGYNEEEQLKAQIIEISADSRNVLREPPPEVDFPFEYSRIAPVAMVMLKEDPRLQKLRFELVPKKVTEEIFWRNYFYRVSLAKQSVQLSSLASVNSQTSVEETREQPQALRGEESKEKGEEENNESAKITNEEIIDEQVDEFISDHPYNIEDPVAVNKESLKNELTQLGVQYTNRDGEGEGGIEEGELWDELQAELEDLGLEEGEGDDGLIVDWEKEMNDMLSNSTTKDT